MHNFIYLIIHILFAFGMFISLKLISIKRANIFRAVTINYMVAAFLTLLSLLYNHVNWEIRSELILPSAVVALLFVVSFILISFSTQKIGIGLTTVLNKVSLIIPVSIGIIFLKQDSHLLQKLLGIGVALISFVLILYKKEESGTKRGIALSLSVFIISGMIDSSMELSRKYVIKESYDQESFLFSLFLFAVIYSSISILLERPLSLSAKNEGRLESKKATLIYGSILGLFNFLTSKMILVNVGLMGGSVVYPIHNASVVSLTALSGLLLFKEKFSIKQWIGILFSVIGVILIASTL